VESDASLLSLSAMSEIDTQPSRQSDNPPAPELTLPVLQLPRGVVFPGVVVTIALESEAAKTAVAAAQHGDGRLLLVPGVTGRTAAVGTIAHVDQVGDMPNGVTGAILRGVGRGRIGAGIVSDRAGLWVGVTPVDDARPSPRIEALTRELRVLAEIIAERRSSRRLPEILRTVHEPGGLADAITAWSEASHDHQLTVLELTEVGARVEAVLAWAKDHAAELAVNAKIREDVAEGVDKQQREFLLRQQLAAIRKELGETDEGGDDVRAKVEAIADQLPEKVRVAVERELGRLERSSSQSPEQGWIRTWIERVLELPWGTATVDAHDLVGARAVLDADHQGLDDVKDRIVEFLAVRKLRAIRDLATRVAGETDRSDDFPRDEADDAGDDNPAAVTRDAHSGKARSRERRSSGQGAMLTLVGPPGVGKTSLGESIAKAMGRSFVRVALGGVRDEAEIRGHRRTYVGAQPGRIVRAIAESGSMNPVVLLDEIDKLSPGGWSGDPTAALLEVLDPAQNHTFRDHYLEVELDLSDVVFIATANTLDTIAAPLLDRVELIRLDGYTEDEKVSIARHHLLPRQLDAVGLAPHDVSIDDDALRDVVANYTREAGVRSLERELGKLVRKIATTFVTSGSSDPIAVTVDDVRQHLGRVKVHHEAADQRHAPGVVNGLAVTGSGGDVLLIETSAYDGEPGVTLTGQLGDVMKESAHIALSWVRAHATQLGIDSKSLNRRFHVHVPAGATPKDGPSAGITMSTALVSLLTGREVQPGVAMTGEVTLQGRVLPIGGVKQKVMAAHRAGLTTVVLPKRNGDDLDDLPDAVRAAMTIHLADTLDDVFAVALTPAGPV
jgi:ATP-dependent Lon protease